LYIPTISGIVESVGQSSFLLFCRFVRLLDFNSFIYQQFEDLLKVLDRTCSNYFVGLLDWWNLMLFIDQHFGDLLKVLDRALSNYFVSLLEFNGFIYRHFEDSLKVVDRTLCLTLSTNL